MSEDTSEATPPKVDDGMSVDEETAERDFENFCLKWEMDVDPVHMNEEDEERFNKTKRLITLAIRRGRCVIEDDGVLIYTPFHSPNKNDLRFKMPDGEVIMASDSRKEGHNVERSMKVLAQLTGQSKNRFKKMDGRDFKFCQAVVALFLD